MRVFETIKKEGLKELSNLMFASSKTRRLLMPLALKKLKKRFGRAGDNLYELPKELEAQYYYVKALLQTACQRLDEKLISPDVLKTVFDSFIDNVFFKGIAQRTGSPILLRASSIADNMSEAG